MGRVSKGSNAKNMKLIKQLLGRHFETTSKPARAPLKPEPGFFKLETETLTQTNDYYDGQIDHYHGQDVYFREAEKEQA